MEEEELKGLVQSWRTANPHIVNYWYEIDGAVKAAVKERKMTKVGMVTVYYQSGMLKIALPSGRVLSYVRPRMTVNRFGSESVSYEGVGTNRKWTRIESYGAKFCENIVQATARDVLAEAMLRLEKKGFLTSCAISMMKWCLKCRRGHPRWKKSMESWRYALTGVRGFRLRLRDLKVRFTRKIRRSLWGGCNREGYPDPTAGIAIGRVMKQEKRKKEGGRRRMFVSIGNSRMDKKFNCMDMTYEDFVSRLSKTKYTAETMEQYRKMPKGQQDNIKDVGGFVLGKLKGGRRKKDCVISRSAITLDMDYGTQGIIDELEMFFDMKMVVYSTHKHTPEKPRLRIIIFLTRDVTPDEYGAVSRMLASDIGIDFSMIPLYEPSRLMYWPSTSSDGEYVFQEIEGNEVDPDEVLSRYKDWHDVSAWPVSNRQASVVQRDIKKTG